MAGAEGTQRAELTEAEICAAQSACQALAVDCAEIVDTQDYARLREIFAEDAVFARPTNPGEPIRGVENIVTSFQSRPRNRLTQHLVTNIRVRVESPRTASGSCRILLYVSEASEVETSEGRKAAAKQIIGIYQDRYVRTQDGWRFAERRGRTLFHT
jgi:ketosteroid isomerase-like protein